MRNGDSLHGAYLYTVQTDWRAHAQTRGVRHIGFDIDLRGKEANSAPRQQPDQNADNGRRGADQHADPGQHFPRGFDFELGHALPGLQFSNAG
jgi:hypothetical protein